MEGVKKKGYRVNRRENKRWRGFVKCKKKWFKDRGGGDRGSRRNPRKGNKVRDNGIGQGKEKLQQR